MRLGHANGIVKRVRLFAVATALLVSSPAFGESPAGGGARQIRKSLDGEERAAVGVDSGVRRFIRATLEDGKSVASFPLLDAVVARAELDAESSGAAPAREPEAARPLRLALQEGTASREARRGRSIRADLDGERVALSTPLPARRIRTTLE